MLFARAITGGPEVNYSPVETAIAGFMEVREEISSRTTRPHVELVFIIPGSVYRPDFSGRRMGAYSKKNDTILVQFVVPEGENTEERAIPYVIAAFREAVESADAYFRKKRLDFPAGEYRANVDVLETRLRR